MITGRFYFLSDEFYDKFYDCGLMGNKDYDEHGKHGRPCFYCFEFEGYYWMVPISSQLDKFRKLYEDKMKRYNNKYDGIRFGYVNGQLRAFLIQNLCPVTDKYIESEYMIENNTRPVTIDPKFTKEINGIVRKVVRLYKERNIKIVLTDLEKILSDL